MLMERNGKRDAWIASVAMVFLLANVHSLCHLRVVKYDQEQKMAVAHNLIVKMVSFI